MSTQPPGKRLSALKLYSRGVTSLNEGRYKKAIILLSAAIKLGGKTVSACCELGLARFELAQIQPVKDSNDPRKWFFPSTLYARDVDIVEVEEYLNTYIDLHPDKAGAFVFRANLREEYGLTAAALPDYDRAVQLNPDYADAYNKRGYARFVLNDYYEALQDFTEAIRLDSTLVLAYCSRAQINTILWRDSEASSDLKMAVSLGSDENWLREEIEHWKWERETLIPENQAR